MAWNAHPSPVHDVMDMMHWRYHLRPITNRGASFRLRKCTTPPYANSARRSEKIITLHLFIDSRELFRSQLHSAPPPFFIIDEIGL